MRHELIAELMVTLFLLSMLSMVGSVSAPITGDINGDGIVNIRDGVIVGVTFGSRLGDPNYNPNADIAPEGAPDGAVNMQDVALWALHFGEVDPPWDGVTHKPCALVPAQAIWVEPPSTTGLGMGDTFVVDVKVNVTDPPGAATGMVGFQYNLTWDSTVLRAVEIQTHADNVPTGDLLLGWTRVFIASNKTGVTPEGLGYHVYAVAATAFTAAFTGVASLCTYTFKVMYQPSFPEPDYQGLLNLDEAYNILVDDTATPIPHATEDGAYHIRSVVPELPKVGVDPPFVKGVFGQTFNLDIAIEPSFPLFPAYDLFGFEFKLSYNTTVLDALEGIEGAWFVSFAGPHGTYPICNIDETNGIVHAASMYLDGRSAIPSGSGDLMTIVFNATSEYLVPPGIPEHDYPMDLYDVMLVNSQSGLIEYYGPNDGIYREPYRHILLSQLRSDGVTVIPEGGTTPESTVVFMGPVIDPEGDQVRLEIELRKIGEPFTGEPTPETISDFVPSRTEVTITRYGLVDAGYHWQYRAKDIEGAVSDWTEFGIAGNIDFTVHTSTLERIWGIPVDFRFERDLSVKGRGGYYNYPDVRYLQIIFNTDPDTQVATSGDGSPGDETTYFGDLTESAVKRFQKKHGLPETGYVGIMTRGKLNEILNAKFTEEYKQGFGLLDREERKSAIWEYIKSYKNNYLPEDFPKELVLATAAQETGDYAHWNNEHVADDWGRGIMQITYPDYYVGAGGVDSDSEDCRKARNRESKIYSSRYYSNTLRGIEANINDGLFVLKEKYGQVKQDAIPSEGITKDGTTWTKNEIIWMSTLQRYNPREVDRLNKIGDELIELADGDFDGFNEEYARLLGDKFKSAYLEGITLYSPAQLHVYDSEGNVTGLVNGTVREDIPNSIYDNETRTVFIFFPSHDYYYNVMGVEAGTYRLDAVFFDAGESVSFTATDIPIVSGAVHQYTIDWVALSLGEEGATLQTDSDGDGTFEQAITADSELTRDEFLLQSADVNDDRIVNIIDGVILGVAFGSRPGDPNWNPIADIVPDNFINIQDIVLWAVHFGETY